MATLTILPSTHWLNGWFLKLFSLPVVHVNDVEMVSRWGEPVEVKVDAGVASVSVGARYHRSSSVLGSVESNVEVKTGDSLSLVARNGFFNHSPFMLHEADQRAR